MYNPEDFVGLGVTPPGLGATAWRDSAHDQYVDSVAEHIERHLGTIEEKPKVIPPRVVLAPKVTLVAYDPPPTYTFPPSLVPTCIELIQPSECPDVFGGGPGAGSSQGYGFGGDNLPYGGPPTGRSMNLPGTGNVANVFMPVLGSLLVTAGKTVLAILATEGATELMNGILKRYNVPWIKFRFRTGNQNAQPYRGAAPVRHGKPGALWGQDSDQWDQF